MPLHSSLGDRTRLHLKKIKRKKKERKEKKKERKKEREKERKKKKSNNGLEIMPLEATRF